MEHRATPGQLFRDALVTERPLQIVGTINAYCALMAETVGFKALYLSGAGVANMSYGLPDLGMTTLDHVLEDARRITRVSKLPLLVDIDTGWEDAEGIEQTIRSMIQAGVAAVHLEDQVSAKRCGHRPNKTLVSTQAMVQRLESAIEARRMDPDFYIIARTDAVANEGVDAAILRAQAYVKAGADAIFAEALTDLQAYARFCHEVGVPVLANITEFGQTPLYSIEALREVGVSMALYPLSAVRAMNHAAMNVYSTLRKTGSQESLIDQMQDRETLYKMLRYYEFES